MTKSLSVKNKKTFLLLILLLITTLINILCNIDLSYKLKFKLIKKGRVVYAGIQNILSKQNIFYVSN